jgi:outer membrane protein assembly factor BamA
VPHVAVFKDTFKSIIYGMGQHSKFAIHVTAWLPGFFGYVAYRLPLYCPVCMLYRRLAILLLLCNICCIAATAQEGKSSGEERHKPGITGVPILSYNSSYGVIVGAMGMGFFNLDRRDTVSPASQAGLGGGYTENKSWFVSAFGQLYFDQDRWRITAAMGLSDVNFQYFEAASESSEGGFVDYGSVSKFGFLKVLRKLKGHLYGGVLLKLQHANTTFANNDTADEANMNGVGLSVLFDSRNTVYNPSKGLQASVNYLMNASWMGSDEAFNSVVMYANYYHRINRSGILAARVSLHASVGDVPFDGQRAVGGKDIRGYTNGAYRGNQVYSGQAEYRWNFYKRWGAVGFFGVAFTEEPSSVLLPGGGLGLRFMALPSRNINIGVDGALGKDDKGIYFRISEAF